MPIGLICILVITFVFVVVLCFAASGENRYENAIEKESSS